MPARTVEPIFLQPEPGGIYLSSPQVSERLRIAPEIAHLIMKAREPIELTDDPAEFGLSADEFEAVVMQLLQLGFLVKTDGDDSAPADLPVPWDAWGEVAWWFHQRTRNAPYVVPESDPERYRPHKEELLSRPRPAAFLPSSPNESVLLLPRVRQPFTMTYQEILENRRTHREFSPEPLSLDTFATLLHYSFAPLRFSDAGMMGVVQLRASASAGARHETEAYVAVFSVDGVEPGIYRYDNLRHGLVLVDDGADREVMEELTYGQGFCRTSAFAAITVAVTDRMSWKYRHPRTYRAVMQDVGHVAQVFSMTATALGVGAAITGAFRDDETDRRLRLPGPEQFSTFFMACGLPIRGSDGLPVDHTSPRSPWSV